ncbi:MAG: arsenate reductase family protein [Actinomycetota bacterium]
MKRRNFFKDRLTVKEIDAIAARAGGVRALVAPTRRAEADEIPEKRLSAWIAEDPRRLRRPIIDTGTEVSVGFTKAVRERLSSVR